MRKENKREKTYIMLKPDSYKRRLMGEIIGRIEKKGFTITAMKMMTLTDNIVKEHYSNVSDKPFFPEIVSFMTSGPVVGMIVEGEEVIKGMRKLIGATHWYEAMMGTIRGDYSYMVGENLIHGSDSEESAKEEIKRFFN